MRQELIEMLALDFRTLWIYEDIMLECIDEPEDDREYQQAEANANFCRARMQGAVKAAGMYDPAMKDVDPAMLSFLTKHYHEERVLVVEDAIIAALDDDRCYYGKPRID